MLVVMAVVIVVVGFSVDLFAPVAHAGQALESTAPRTTSLHGPAAAETCPALTLLELDFPGETDVAVDVAALDGFVGVGDVCCSCAFCCAGGFGTGLLVADRARAFRKEGEFSCGFASSAAFRADATEDPRPPATPATDSQERKDEEKEFGEGVPDKLPIEVFKGDFAGDGTSGCDQAHTQNTVEESAVVAGDEEGREGDQRQCRVCGSDGIDEAG